MIKETKGVNRDHILKLAEVTFFKDDYQLANSFFDFAIENSKDDTKYKARIKNLQSITYLKHAQFESSLKYIEEAYEYYPDKYLLLIKSYLELFEAFQNKRMDDKYFKKLLEASENVETGSMGAKNYLKALALYNLGNEEDACKTIMLNANELKESNVKLVVFCEKDSSFPSLLTESLKIVDLFVIEF